MANILIAEDDESLCILMTERLKKGHNITTAKDGLLALDILDNSPIDLLITDVSMPKMDGFTLLKTIRKNGMKLPVLILTAKESFIDKQTGFSVGTDDYMTKPVNFDELNWRIDALLRRSNISNENQIKIGMTSLNHETYTVTNKDESIMLSPKEFELIYKLLSYPGVIFTKTQLFDEIWGYDSESNEDTIKTHINRLRNKLSAFTDFEIVTIKGLGYKGLIHKKEK